MKQTLFAVLAAASLGTGCGTDGAPVAVDSPALTEMSTATTVEAIEATATPTTTSNWDPNSDDPFGDAAQKEAERQVSADPDGSSKLATEMSKLAGEKLGPVDAQLLAGYVCVMVELNKLSDELDFAEADLADEMSQELDMSQEDALRLLALSVRHRCP